MKPKTKTMQIFIRFDEESYQKISEYAKKEHRGLGEFVRHAALFYIESFNEEEVRINGYN